MNHLEVTADMRARVLDRLRNTDPARSPKSVSLRRYWPMAACLALLVTAGGVLLPRAAEQSPDPPAQVVPDMVDYGSAAELAQATGLPVEDLSVLPFQPESITYTAYWKELAQVTYTRGDQTAAYRVSAGTEDNSGIYETFGDTADLELNGRTVTLKGNGGVYPLALWTDGEYAYSLYLSQPLPEADWADLLA